MVSECVHVRTHETCISTRPLPRRCIIDTCTCNVNVTSAQSAQEVRPADSRVAARGRMWRRVAACVHAWTSIRIEARVGGGHNLNSTKSAENY